MKKNNSNPFGGIIAGILLLIGGTCLLWWNEGNNVKNIQGLAEAKKVLVEVASDKVDSKNEGKLVVTSGKLDVIDEKLTDEMFKVEVKSAKLERVVEVYAWEERSETEDDTTRYYYEKKWLGDIPDSSNFHEGGHTNPSSKSVPNETYIAEKVKLGEFELSSDLKSYMSTNAAYGPKDEDIPEGYSKADGFVTNAKEYANPEIGDIRITWVYNDWTEASVMAMQKGNSFAKFTTKNGRDFNRIEKGIVNADGFTEMIQKEDKLMKWLFRGLGALLIVIGYGSILSPISKLASFVPILGNVVGGIIGVISFIIGLVHSLLIIVIAWFRFRPLLAIILLVVIAALIVGLVMLLKKNKAKAAETKPVEATE